MMARTWIAFAAAVLAIASGRASAQDVALTGPWHLASFRDDGTTVLANEARNETLIVTVKDGQMSIANARSGSPLEMRLTEQRGPVGFYTAGPAADTDKYRMTFRDDGKMTLVTDTSYMEFGRRQGVLAPLAPVAATSGDHIVLQDAWARQYWFEGFDRDFETAHGKSFAECFSDEQCLRTCDSTNACVDGLPQELKNALADAESRDPLFVDNEAGAKLLLLAESRRSLLDLKARLHREETKSQLAYKTETLELLRKLTVDGSPPVAKPADGDRYFAQGLETAGCTVAGFVPLVGNLLSLGCGVRSLSTLQPPQIATNPSTTSLAGLFDGIIRTQNEYHDKAYHQFDERIASALKDEQDVLSLHATITGPEFRIRQPSAEEITDSIFDAVWPYAFFLLSEGSSILAPSSASGTCTDRLEPYWTLLSTGKLSTGKFFGVRVPMEPGFWGVSLHYALSGSDFYYRRYGSDSSILFTWTLNIGTIGAYNQIGEEAMAAFKGYLKRNRNISVRGELQDRHRVYAKTPYAVRQKILVQINKQLDDFVEYDPQNPGFMVWPPKDERTEALDWLGTIRDSFYGRAGRVAVPSMQCGIFTLG